MTRELRPAPVVAETPAGQSCFFGYHDITPWAPDDSRLLVHRVDPALDRLPSGAPAEICLWTPGSPKLEPIGTTTAWNFQMGARAQWLPDSRIVYNVVRDGRLGAVVCDTQTGGEQDLPFAVGAIDPAGEVSLAPHFGRLDRHWPSYGVPGAPAPEEDVARPEGDGLWQMDMASGRVSLWLSVAAVAAHAPVSVPDHLPQFLSHPLYSPSGKRVAFLHRFLTADGATYTRLMVAARDGGGLRVLAEEKVSHFCWRDDGTLLVWCRRIAGAIAAARRRGWLASPLLRPALRLARRLRGTMRQALINEHYFMIPADDPGARTVVGAASLPVDGHPMFRPDEGGRWIVTDTYPDEHRQQALILFDTREGRRIDIGSFRADAAVGDGDIKCDLHPRWNRAGTRIAVDTTRNGTRQVAIVDVADRFGDAA